MIKKIKAPITLSTVLKTNDQETSSWMEMLDILMENLLREDNQEDTVDQESIWTLVLDTSKNFEINRHLEEMSHQENQEW